MVKREGPVEAGWLLRKQTSVPVGALLPQEFALAPWRSANVSAPAVTVATLDLQVSKCSCMATLRTGLSFTYIAQAFALTWVAKYSFRLGSAYFHQEPQRAT